MLVIADESFILSDHSLAYSFYRHDLIIGELCCLSKNSFISFFLRSFLYVLVRYIWQIVYIFVHRYLYINELYYKWIIHHLFQPSNYLSPHLQRVTRFYPFSLIFLNWRCCKDSVSPALSNIDRSAWRNCLVPRPDFPLSIPVYMIIRYIIIPYNCMNRGFLKFLYNIFKLFGKMDSLLIISNKFSNIIL